jgi:hypothetical protein
MFYKQYFALHIINYLIIQLLMLNSNKFGRKLHADDLLGFSLSTNII